MNNHLNIAEMAHSCLFTFKAPFAAFLKQNLKLQRTLKHYYAYAYIHNCISLKQYANATEESEENYRDNPDALKVKILKAGLTFVPEHGWNEKSLALGAKSLGLSSAAHGLIQGGGSELVHYFNFSCNLKLEDYLKEISSTTEKLELQEFIFDALESRLRMVIPYVSKWPEALALMAFPTQLPVHSKNLLDLVDSIWHFYGDKSIAISWYSKRISLAVAYKATELSLIQDRSPDFSNSFDFLQRRVKNIVEAEKVIHTINETGKHLLEFGGGAFITVQNLLGLNRWRR